MEWMGYDRDMNSCQKEFTHPCFFNREPTWSSCRLICQLPLDCITDEIPYTTNLRKKTCFASLLWVSTSISHPSNKFPWQNSTVNSGNRVWKTVYGNKTKLTFYLLDIWFDGIFQSSCLLDRHPGKKVSCVHIDHTIGFV